MPTSLYSQAFGIPRAEALLMDPQQRLLLECMADILAQDPAAASAALRDPLSHLPHFSGVDSHSPASPTWDFEGAGSRSGHGVQSQGMGVYVGVSQLEYARICLEQGTPLTPYYATGEGCGSLLRSCSCPLYTYVSCYRMHLKWLCTLIPTCTWGLQYCSPALALRQCYRSALVCDLWPPGLHLWPEGPSCDSGHSLLFITGCNTSCCKVWPALQLRLWPVLNAS
jgi:hypothetical protein